MDRTVLIMTADTREYGTVASLLREWGYATRRASTVAEIRHAPEERIFVAVMLDLDAGKLDNRVIRTLASELPATPIICLSRERLHPGLENSIRDHVYACLTKPIDGDELGYWLRCIRADGRE